MDEAVDGGDSHGLLGEGLIPGAEGLIGNPGPPFEGRGSQFANPQRPVPIAKINQVGGPALQTSKPVFHPAPPAKMVEADR
jgi:hypothetical protein